MHKLNVGIVDDHLLFAEGIGDLLSKDMELNLSFITNSIPDLLDKLKKSQLQILILDINIPPFNGISLIKEIKAIDSSLKIMILTMYQPNDIGLDMKQFVGDAYVLKISGRQILEEAIAQLKKGNSYLDPNIIEQLKTKSSTNKQLRLTKREREIVSLIAAGKTTKEIAAQLFLSELTIKTHRKNISEKLDSKGVADMISKTNYRI